MNTGDSWTYILSKYYLNTIYHVHPDRTKEILISDNNILNINSLNVTGNHFIQTDDIIIGSTAVNVVSSELNSKLIDIKDIREYLSDTFEVISMNKNVIKRIKEAQIGIELWRYFLYGAILMLILEMILSNAKKQH